MDYNELLNWATDFGYRLQESGAEIYRVEESVSRLLAAYGIKNGEAFAIPNCLIVSFSTPDGEPKTKIRGIPDHGSDVYLIEEYNNLCRSLCREPLPLIDARWALDNIDKNKKSYTVGIKLFAYYVGAGAFCLFFGGNGLDAAVSGICGVSIGFSMSVMTHININLFVKTVLAAFLSALLAIGFVAAHIGRNYASITIGALMALVPGIMFTNFMRDIMAGDMLSGLNKLAEAFLIAGAIAIGTGVAIALFK